MWPQALQMTRDECRGILRRLELESYSHVISVFRAQGGLSDNKAKLLEELRGIFHISQERHRAEARRVANDEQLSTIAEAISGPNTWQEWSREGRRSFPMLPRVAPQTALALIANNVANETAAENCKLPYPADTAAAVAEEQAAETRETGSWEGAKREGYVVTDDPFKMPEIPAGPRKNLKRNTNDNQTSGGGKKRLISDASPTKQQQQKQQKQYAHITANSASSAPTANASSNIRKLYHNHSNNKLQQQRYFHQQQIQKQKLAAKKSLTAPTAGGGAATGGKRQTPAKSGRKTQSKAQEQKQQQQQQQQQQMLQKPLVEARHVGYGSKEHQNVELLAEDLKQDQLHSQSVSQPQHIMPQIAASKKDITKNLSKLQLPVTASASATMPSVTGASARVDAHVMSTSPVMSGSLPPALHGKMEKQLISTPVQKFILEDRQPPPQPLSLSQPLQAQSTSASQIMTLPQISAAATKLRAVNTTILPPGTKLTPKKMSGAAMVTNTGVGINVLSEHSTQSSTLVSGGSSSSGGVAGQSQVYNIIESSGTSGNSAQAPLTTPTHTPPAIIQLQSSNDTVPPQQPTQGKVLTTKLLPIMLSGSTGASGVAGTGIVTSSANITKIETLNNGATLVTAGGANSTNPIGTTIIKNMPSTLLLSPNQSGGMNTTGGTIFSTLSSGTSVFRKPPIIKTGTIGMGASNTLGKLSSNFNVSTSNTGPQIISSVKLTPAISTTTVATTHTHQQQQQFLQQQLKNVPTTGLRTSVKICQSPNGKVFIQPANVDAATKVKLQGNLQHKLLPNSLVGTTGVTANANTTPPQRIAIQKVQIIPAPLHSPGHLPFQAQQSHQSKATTTTLTIGNKGNMNMIFMPAAGGRTTSGTITLAKSSVAGNVVGNIVAKTQSSQQQQQQQQQQQMHIQPTQHVQEAGKPTNVVVIGSTSTALPAAATLPQTATTLKSPTYTDGSGKIITTPAASSLQLDTNQMITEDTPVDILNMPIIVDGGDGSNVSAVSSNIVDSVTVLSSALVESATQQAQSQQQQQQQPTIILGATDWEMELDQATAVAAASKARTQYSRQSSSSSNSGGNKTRKSAGEQHLQLNEKPVDEGDAIIIDDSFDDVIIEEQEEITEVEEQQQEHEKMAYTISNEGVGENVELKDMKVGNAKEAKSQAYTNVNEEEEPIDVIDEEQKQSTKRSQESNKTEGSGNTSSDGSFTNVPNTALATSAAVTECETDAGFDETIVTEIDENTAIEYIEEEQNATVPLEDVEKSEGKGVTSTEKVKDLLNSATDMSEALIQISNEQNNKIEERVASIEETVAQDTTRAEATTSSVVGKELLGADVDGDAAVFASNEVGNVLAPLNAIPISENSQAEQ